MGMAGPHQKTCVFVGDYEILGRLAAGGMAEILLARLDGTEGFEKQVALKRLLPKYARNPEYAQMFIQEARIMARLHHKNIVQIFDVAESAGIHYLVMEHLEGVDAKKIMNAHPNRCVPYALAVHIGINVCAGLQFAHELKDPQGRPLEIVHRDISPANIVVTHTGGVKLIDFGIATARGREFETQTGIVKGTEAYMSPEQARCQLVDRRSDIYSLAVVLFEMTTGKLPTRNGRHHLAGRREVEPARLLHPEYPPDLEAILLRALSMSPDERFPTASEFQDALEAFSMRHRLNVSQDELGKTARSIAGQNAEIGSAPTVALADSGKLHNPAPSAKGADTSPTAPAGPAAAAPANAPPIIAARPALSHRTPSYTPPPAYAPEAAPEYTPPPSPYEASAAEPPTYGAPTAPYAGPAAGGHAAPPQAGYAAPSPTPAPAASPVPVAYGAPAGAAYVATPMVMPAQRPVLHPTPSHPTPSHSTPPHQTPSHHTPSHDMPAPVVSSRPSVHEPAPADDEEAPAEAASAVRPSSNRFLWIGLAAGSVLFSILFLVFRASGAPAPQASPEHQTVEMAQGSPQSIPLQGGQPQEPWAPPPLPDTYTSAPATVPGMPAAEPAAPTLPPPAPAWQPPTPISPEGEAALQSFKALQQMDDPSLPPAPRRPIKRKSGRVRTSEMRNSDVGKWDPKSPFLPGGR